MTRSLFAVLALLAAPLSRGETASPSPAPRQGPWTRERAWNWYRAQPWIRGCNYMPASAANRVDQWQALGSDERFAEVERELSLAEEIGFNTLRLLIEESGFGVWLVDHDGFMSRFERYLDIMRRHGLRAIVVLGNDCSRPKELWTMPKPGVQTYEIGYHGGRRVTQHGSNRKAVGYTVLDDPELRPQFFRMCGEILTKYRADDRILFWDLWNEPGNNNRNALTMRNLKELFELAWRIDPVQPLAADVWSLNAEDPNAKNAVEILAGDSSDIISYHRYANYRDQKRVIDLIRRRWERPMVNTEWLARIKHDDPVTSYPLFAQENVGCVCWGFVAGKYQTYEPYEPMWKNRFEFRRTDWAATKWYHDLFRPSYHPYDPEEANVLRRINREMDAEYRLKAKGEGAGSLRTRIARTHRILGEDMWYGYRRIRFDFGGRAAWVVEPSVAPVRGNPWTWTMQWSEAFVDRTGVPDLLKRGFHHATIDLFATRMDEKGLRDAAAFQDFLVKELGFAPKANLIGMSWGGFFSVRYASTVPQNVAKIYLDAPLLNFDGFGKPDRGRIAGWADRVPPDGNWSADPEMPVNRAEPIAKAGIPILLAYGGQDQTVPPNRNCLPFVARFRAAGGQIEVVARGLFGHHPHGFDPDKTGKLVDFMFRDCQRSQNGQ